jgi:hypothetical protein
VVTAEFHATAVLPAGYVITQRLGTAGSIVGNYDTTSRLDGGGTLIWSKNDTTIASPGYGDYTAAVAACSAMNTAQTMGYTDWRLPTQQELSGLVNTDIGALFDASWNMANTWTSTVGDSGPHYIVNLFQFNLGYVAGDSDGMFFTFVSCVH